MVDFNKTYKIGFNTKVGVKNLERLDKVLEKVKTDAKQLESSFKSMGKVVGDTGRDFDRAGKAAKESGKDIKKGLGRKARDPVNKLSKAAKIAQTKVKSIGKASQDAGRKMASLGKKLTVGLTLPIVGAGVASLKFARDLNEGMANVSTLMSGGIESVKKLKTTVQDMSVETGKSTDDLTDGLFQVISAFQESADNAEQLSAVTRASVAGRSSTVEALNLLSAVTKGYGDTSSDALKKVSDLAFMTNKLGQTTFPELAASMGKVVPLAATFKTSQEDLFTVFATATGITGNAAEVSTQLSSIYSGMLNPTKELKAVIKDLGFKSAISMLETKGLAGSLEALGEEVGTSKEELGKLFARKEAQVLLFSLLGEQAGDFSDKLGQMQNVMGATDEAYKKQTEGINKAGHAWNQTRARMVRFAQNVGDKLIPIVTRFFKKLDPWLKKLEAMDDATLEWWMKFVGLHAAIGPVVLVVGALAVKVGTLLTMMKAASTQTAIMNSAAGGVAPVMDRNTRAVKGFSKALGAMAIIAAGVDFSQFIQKAFVEPFEAKQLERGTGAENTVIKTERLLARKGGLGFKEKTAALEKVRNAQADLPGTQLAPSNIF